MSDFSNDARGDWGGAMANGLIPMTQPKQSELEQKLNELSELNKLGGRGHGDLADTCYTCGISPSKLLAYITANYTPNSEVAERERAARIDEIRRTRPHLTYPGMVYYGERMNELRSDETEEI